MFKSFKWEYIDREDINCNYSNANTNPDPDCPDIYSITIYDTDFTYTYYIDAFSAGVALLLSIIEIYSSKNLDIKTQLLLSIVYLHNQKIGHHIIFAKNKIPWFNEFLIQNKKILLLE